MLEQCWALILLKARLMRAMWTGAHTASLLLTVITLFGMLVLSVAGSVALFFVGWKLLPSMQEPTAPILVLDGITLMYCMFWASGLLMELQRSDVIDLRKMLYLPISPRMVFGMNFIASLFGPSLIFFVPGALGLLTGLSLHYGPLVFVWGVPLAAAFFFMFGAWAFYARGWLAVLMEDKRRRRLVLTILPLIFVGLSQTPGLISASMQNFKLDPDKEALLKSLDVESLLFTVNRYFPSAWLPYGAWSGLQGNVLTAFACVGGCVLVMALGLLLGYRATMRLYRGGNGGKVKSNKKQRVRRPLTARRLALVDEDTAALAAASFLSYLRHPNIRMLLIMPLFMGCMILFLYRSGAYGARMGVSAGGNEWAPIMVLVWPFFNFSYVLFNVFGIERESFRGLVLLPTARYKYLLAKNLALFPFIGGTSVLFVVVGAIFLDMPTRLIGVAALQVVQLFLLYSIIGNVVSIYLPHQIGWNGARSSSSRVLMMCVGLISALLLGVLMLPTTLCLYIDKIAAELWDYHGISLGIPVSCALLAITLAVYHFSLRFSGDLLMDREIRVLDRLLRDRE